MRKAACLVVVALFSALAAAAQDFDFTAFVGDLVDLERLSRVDDVPIKMESSYDRAGANNDGFNSAWLKGDVYTIADLKGPGVIRRIWTARPAGRLRIYLDGNAVPLIDMPTEDFFAARRSPFERPIVGPMGGGNYSYFPIPFQKSIRIQITPLQTGSGEPFGAYHHVYYQQYPAGTRVRSLRLPLSQSEQAALDRVLALWRNPGTDPKKPAAGSETIEREITLEPGRTADPIDLAGPGAIDALHLELTPRDPKLLRDLLIRMRWDDEAAESVNCPLGDFFGNGFNYVPYRTLPMGLTENGFYSFFSMPFQKRAQITLVNESATTPVKIAVRITHHACKELSRDTGYFNAKWRRESVVGVNMHLENRSGDYNYRFLDLQGRGRYIGANLNVFNHYFNWWGEGDPMIFVDGEKWPPSLHGTGTEEFFNDAWGFHDRILAPGSEPGHKEQNVNPTSGVLLPGIGVSHYWGPNAVFVFNIADSVPFRDRILVTLEHGSENEMTNDYASTAFWYALPGARDFFLMLPVEERAVLPPGLWSQTREIELKRYVGELRRELYEAADLIPTRPTDVTLHRPRIRLLRYLVRNADVVGLKTEERDHLQREMDAFRPLPMEQRYRIIDRLLVQTAAILRSR